MQRAALLCALAAAALGAPAAHAAKPHVLFIVADDLGYNDLGWTNGGKTHTPTIDALRAGGVHLSDYYTYKVCAPSRASMMSGRYPWGVGFYDMSHDSEHCVNTSTTLLPQVMADLGYRVHGAGKWDVGMIRQHCTPTARGFESYMGYYTACTADYWYHGAPGNNWTASKCGGVDFSNSTAAGGIRGAAMSGPDSVNGTYDAEVFTQRAVDAINAHDAADAEAPLFFYLAYHNVHDACTEDRFALGLNAPCGTVDMYGTTQLDTWKVQAAMTTELDYGVGNVTAALKAKGMLENTVIVLVSDNGGPLDHSSNAPLRDGKGSWFEGGVRVMAIVNSPLLPASARGTTWPGMAHASDWYVTLAEGVAGGTLPASTGPRAPDGRNLWSALAANGTSPRTEVIHGVNGSQVVPPLTKDQCSSCSSLAARFGDYKIILGVHGNRGVQAWPTPGPKAVPFGQSQGQHEAGTDHCRAPLLGKATLDPATGARVEPAAYPTGGAEAPASASSTSGGTWLFHLPTDPSESKNLAGDAAYASMIHDFKHRLRAAAETGPALAFEGEKGYTEALCAIQEQSGYLEPLDWHPTRGD